MAKAPERVGLGSQNVPSVPQAQRPEAGVEAGTLIHGSTPPSSAPFTYSVNFVKWSSQGMLRMSCEAMNELFQPTVSGIIQHIGEHLSFGLPFTHLHICTQMWE